MKRVTYTIETRWTAGDLMPADIGQRFLRTLQQFEPLSHAMRNWPLLDKRNAKAVKLGDAAPKMEAFVRHNVIYGDFGEPEPDLGYTLFARGSADGSELGGPGSVNITARVGGKFDNSIEFEVGDQLSPPDPTSITYPIYRGALEAIISIWPCPWAFAYSYEFKDLPPLEPWDGKDVIAHLEALQSRPVHFRAPYEVAWIAYLSPKFAKGLIAPPELLSERTPGGGAILSAVQERLDEDNPDHMRRSHLLEAILNERLGFGPRYGPKAPDRAAEPPARVGPY